MVGGTTILPPAGTWVWDSWNGDRGSNGSLEMAPGNDGMLTEVPGLVVK